VPSRIAVVGGAGSGKTTVARRLAAMNDVPYVELDGLHWGPNWTACPKDEFRARVEGATSGDAWVVDGNYTGQLGDLVLERAELVVWLDLPLRVTFPRLWRRTRQRMRDRTELWAGNRETWRGALFSRDSLFLWELRMNRQRRARYKERLAKYDVVRLRSRSETKAWLGRIRGVNVTRVLRVYRIPFSTNVERVSLALAHKGLEVEWEDVDAADRSPVEGVSGQPLVPVLVHEGRVIADSMVILRYLEELHPEPPLFPRDEARRAELEIFLDWFNRIWKRPPNEIESERAKAAPDAERIDELGRELTGSLELFEAMLAGRDYLFGDFSAADCAAFPFLKYGLLLDEADTEEFHLILREHLALNGRYPRVEKWIRRVDARRRA
jgi:glutathione S-transferase/adenylate kinase family enzyme